MSRTTTPPLCWRSRTAAAAPRAAKSAALSSASTASVCVEPALILEEAARELDEELRRERESHEARLRGMLDECWDEMVREMR